MVVLALVNMYLLVGPPVMNSYLQQVSETQRRLVKLYVDRIYRKRVDGREGA